MHQIIELLNLKTAILCFLSKIPDLGTSTCTLLISLYEEDLHLLDFIVSEINANKINLINQLNQNEIECIKVYNHINNNGPSSNRPLITRSQSLNHSDREILQRYTDSFKSVGDDSSESSNKQKSMECLICYDRCKNIIFLPCAHLTCCVQCSVSMTNCPLCRKHIEATIRTYF